MGGVGAQNEDLDADTPESATTYSSIFSSIYGCGCICITCWSKSTLLQNFRVAQCKWASLGLQPIHSLQKIPS
jgi:hypothetical protein